MMDTVTVWSNAWMAAAVLLVMFVVALRLRGVRLVRPNNPWERILELFDALHVAPNDRQGLRLCRHRGRWSWWVDVGGVLDYPHANQEFRWAWQAIRSAVQTCPTQRWVFQDRWVAVSQKAAAEAARGRDPAVALDALRYLERIGVLVEEFGWVIQGVPGTATTPSCAYTVGLTTFDRHPELVSFGPPHQAAQLLTALCERVSHGQPLQADSTLEGLPIDGTPLRAVGWGAVADRHGEPTEPAAHLAVALRLMGTDITTLQIVGADLPKSLSSGAQDAMAPAGDPRLQALLAALAGVHSYHAECTLLSRRRLLGPPPDHPKQPCD